MRDGPNKTFLFLVAGPILGWATSAGAITVYSNTIPTVDTNPSPNYGVSGDRSQNGTNGVVFDDVQIDNLGNPLNQNTIALDGATVGILREPGAGPVTINAYVASTITPGSPTAFPSLDTSTVKLFGTVALPAFTGPTEAVVPVNIIPAGPVLVGLNLTDDPTFSELAFGLNFSDTGPNNTWNISQPNAPDTNYDGAWDYNLVTHSQATFSEVYPDSRPLYTTFNLALSGNVVPEPGSIGLLLGAGVLVLRKRR